VPTLNAIQETTGYIKQSLIDPDGPPVSLYPLPWNEGYPAALGSCNLVWVYDEVQPRIVLGDANIAAGGNYCGVDSTSVLISVEAQFGLPPFTEPYAPPAGCYLQGVNPATLYCNMYTRRAWYRMRLFLVDCRSLTLREVTNEALAEPIEWTQCFIPSVYRCSGGACGLFPAADCGQPGYCPPVEGNPGFLDAVPTLECPT
jgi:hypothetical protein